MWHLWYIHLPLIGIYDASHTEADLKEGLKVAGLGSQWKIITDISMENAKLFTFFAEMSILRRIFHWFGT